MKLSNPLKIIDTLDVAPLQRKLAGTPQATWELRTFRQDSTIAQIDTESIILCWSGFATSTRDEFRHDAFQTNQWTDEFQFFKSELESINATIAMHYPGGTLRSMLTRLSPGGHIRSHKDLDPTFDRSHRLHLAIVTDSDVDFLIDGNTYHILEGSLVEFDNLRTHSVRNNGELSRIHLIVDVLDSEYIS
jgi:hypothetical protein